MRYSVYQLYYLFQELFLPNRKIRFGWQDGFSAFLRTDNQKARTLYQASKLRSNIALNKSSLRDFEISFYVVIPGLV